MNSTNLCEVCTTWLLANTMPMRCCLCVSLSLHYSTQPPGPECIQKHVSRPWRELHRRRKSEWRVARQERLICTFEAPRLRVCVCVTRVSLLLELNPRVWSPGCRHEFILFSFAFLAYDICQIVFFSNYILDFSNYILENFHRNFLKLNLVWKIQSKLNFPKLYGERATNSLIRTDLGDCTYIFRTWAMVVEHTLVSVSSQAQQRTDATGPTPRTHSHMVVSYVNGVITVRVLSSDVDNTDKDRPTRRNDRRIKPEEQHATRHHQSPDSFPIRSARVPALPSTAQSDHVKQQNRLSQAWIRFCIKVHIRVRRRRILKILHRFNFQIQAESKLLEGRDSHSMPRRQITETVAAPLTGFSRKQDYTVPRAVISSQSTSNTVSIKSEPLLIWGTAPRDSQVSVMKSHQQLRHVKPVRCESSLTSSAFVAYSNSAEACSYFKRCSSAPAPPSTQVATRPSQTFSLQQKLPKHVSTWNPHVAQTCPASIETRGLWPQSPQPKTPAQFQASWRQGGSTFTVDPRNKPVVSSGTAFNLQVVADVKARIAKQNTAKIRKHSFARRQKSTDAGIAQSVHSWIISVLFTLVTYCLSVLWTGLQRIISQVGRIWWLWWRHHIYDVLLLFVVCVCSITSADPNHIFWKENTTTILTLKSNSADLDCFIQ